MFLKKIYLSRYDETRPLKGEIEFEGETGKISLVLSEEEIKDIVKTIANKLVEHSKSAAERMTVESIKLGKEILSQIKLENK